MRFGEAHRARPDAAHHPVGVEIFLIVGTERLDDFGRTLSEPRVHVERGVGAAHELFDHRGQGRRGVLTPPFFGAGQASPTGFVELLPCILEAIGRPDLAIFEPATLLVADLIQGPEDLLGKAVAFIQHEVYFVRAPARIRRFSEQLVEFKLVEEKEPKVSKIGLVAVDWLGQWGSPVSQNEW